MNDIAPVGPLTYGSSGPAPSDDSGRGRAAADVEVKSRPSERLVDRVQISDRARLLDQLRRPAEVRQEVVNKVREAIASGDYSIDARIGPAIERLLADLEIE